VFDGMGVGILATGTVKYPLITENLFNNLYQGVVFSATNFTVGPSNAIITKNRFENIVQQGIYAGANSGSVPAYSNNRSIENTFVQVGNGLNGDPNTPYIDDQTFLPAYPVITFDSTGNISTNDTFVRRIVAESNTTNFANFYYNPLVTGKTTLDDGVTYTLNTYNNPLTNIVKIPLTGGDQMATIRYQLINNYISRKGELIVNITADNHCSISDYYNYSQVLNVIPGSDNFAYSVHNTNTNSFISNDPICTTISTGTQEYFVIDPSTSMSAFITSIINDGNGYYTITTDVSAGFNFKNPYPHHYQIGATSVPDILFVTNVNSDKNYVTVQAKNSDVAVASTIEVQINLVIG
jgi:hypothetical protein